MAEEFKDIISTQSGQIEDVDNMAQVELEPVYGDAMRQMKKTAEVRDKMINQEINDAKKKDGPVESKIKGTPEQRKMHLSESLFENWDDEDDEEEGFAVYIYRLSNLDSLYDYIEDDISFDEFKDKLSEIDENIIDQLDSNLFSLASEWDEDNIFTTPKKAYEYIKKTNTESDPILNWVIRDVGDEYSYYDSAKIEDLLLKNKDKILNFKLNESLTETNHKLSSDYESVIVVYKDDEEETIHPDYYTADAHFAELNDKTDDELTADDIIGFLQITTDEDGNKVLSAERVVGNDLNDTKRVEEVANKHLLNYNIDEALTERKDFSESKLYDELERICLKVKSVNGKSRAAEVYADPVGGGYKVESEIKSVIDKCVEVAEKYNLPYTSRKFRDYYLFTVDLPENESLDEGMSWDEIQAEINKDRQSRYNTRFKYANSRKGKEAELPSFVKNNNSNTKSNWDRIQDTIKFPKINDQNQVTQTTTKASRPLKPGETNWDRIQNLLDK